MIGRDANTHLEDFGVTRATGAAERLEEYRCQCRELPKVRQASWWLQVLDHDSEVQALLVAEVSRKKRRRTS